LVVDIGATTSSATVLSLEDGVFEVLGTARDGAFGGRVFDERISKEIVRRFRNSTRLDPAEDLHALELLQQEAENVKKTLTTNTSALFEIRDWFNGHNVSETLTRNDFEVACSDLFGEIQELVERSLRDAGVAKADMTDYFLVGGSSVIPRFVRVMDEIFGGATILQNRNVRPEEAVVLGAAIQGGILSNEDDKHNFGCCFCDMDLTSVNLGIEINGGLIANPVEKSKVFTTSVDNQSSVSIRVFAGLRPHSTANIHLGTFELSGIPPAPRGVPSIEVTLGIHENRTLIATARDNLTGLDATMMIPDYDATIGKFELLRLEMEATPFILSDGAVWDQISELKYPALDYDKHLMLLDAPIDLNSKHEQIPV
ncbi:ATPase with role in protein import into the ER, partial [Gonapodya sp. JEL0774]